MKTECSLFSPKSYGKLELTTFADYWDMLNCVPPRHRIGGRFVVGEEYADRWQFGGEFPDETANRPVYDCYFAVEGNGYDENDTYVHGYFTIADYKAVTQNQLRESIAIRKATHSPTPWTESPTANPSAEFCLSDANGSIICRFDHWKGRAEAEQDANVRLIKAAPELRTMLERLLDGVLRLPELPPTVSLLDIEQCQKAIAKSYV